jgi:hypothetical protein
MKIPCTVFGKPATVVGYFQGKRGKPRAVVIASGKLRDVALKHIVLPPERYTYTVVGIAADGSEVVH